jgi:hypothetical protein
MVHYCNCSFRSNLLLLFNFALKISMKWHTYFLGFKCLYYILFIYIYLHSCVYSNLKLNVITIKLRTVFFKNSAYLFVITICTFCSLFWLILHTFLKHNQQDATFSRSVYLYELIYIFQAIPPPIIRSTKLYIQRQVLSNQYCCLLLSWMK